MPSLPLSRFARDVEEEKTENSFKDASELKDTDKEEMARKYYKTRSEAESKRRKGDRIYYKPDKGFYIVRLKKLEDIKREIEKALEERDREKFLEAFVEFTDIVYKLDFPYRDEV